VPASFCFVVSFPTFKLKCVVVACRNYALRVRNVEPLLGFSFPDPAEVSLKTAADGSSVFVLEDREMDFDEILKAPLPKAPLEVTFRAHWLAIEGVQPLIPENPLPDGMDVVGTAKKRKAVDSDGAEKDPTVQEVSRRSYSFTTKTSLQRFYRDRRTFCRRLCRACAVTRAYRRCSLTSHNSSQMRCGGR